MGGLLLLAAAVFVAAMLFAYVLGYQLALREEREQAELTRQAHKDDLARLRVRINSLRARNDGLERRLTAALETKDFWKARYREATNSTLA